MADMEEESFANAVTDKLESVTVKDSIPSKKVDSDVFPDAVNSNKSALQENIERKGKNAYYFAHAHKATGPKWDGKAEPKLLSSRALSADETRMKGSSFEYHKSNITDYAFSDEQKSVKLYITMEDVGEKCTEEDISLDFTESSFSLVVKNFKDVPQCLSFGRLTSAITNATYKKKRNRIIVTLKKREEGEWHTVNDKGSPEHDLV